MTMPTWKTDLHALSTYYKAELASFEAWALNKETKLRTHPDLLRACEGYDLKNVLTLCDKAIEEAASPEAFEASFIAILARHWEQTKETALSYLAYPKASANAYLFKLFEQVYPRAADARDLPLFSPGIHHTLTIETHLIPGEHPHARHEHVKLVCVESDLSSAEALKDKPLSHWLVVGNTLFNAHEFIAMCQHKKLPLAVVGQFISDLNRQHPSLIQALSAYHPSVATFIDTLKLLHTDYTVRQMLSALTLGLKQAGTHLTGAELAGAGAGRAIAQFKEHLALLSATSQQQLLSLSDGNLSVQAVLKKLESPEQCVEVASNWLKSILSYPFNQARLDQELVLQSTGPLKDELKKQQENLNSEREGSTQRLPAHSLRQFVQSVVLEENNLVAIAEFLSLFDTAEAYSICFEQETVKHSLQNLWHLGQILIFLTPIRIGQLFEALKNTSLNPVKIAKDFFIILKHLSPEQRTVVYEAYQGRLPSIIKTSEDFAHIIHYLSLEQGRIVCEALKEHLHSITQTALDFVGILTNLSPEQRTVIYETYKDHLPSLIQTAGDFSIILQYLSLERGRSVCEALKEHLPSIIKTPWDFITILQSLSPEQSRAVCESCKEHLHSITQTAGDFSIILANLSPEQRTVIYETYKDHLPSLIQTAMDFLILFYLSPEQCAVVCETIKDHLPQLIQTDTDMETLDRVCLPDKVRLLKHYYLLASLDAYMTRVKEEHGKNDFSCGFWQHKTSVSLTRAVDYELAKKIRKTIIEQSPYGGDIDTLLSPKNLKDMRDEIVTNLKTSDLFFNKNYVDRGMNSEALTKAFHLVRTPEPRQSSPGNGRR